MSRILAGRYMLASALVLVALGTACGSSTATSQSTPASNQTANQSTTGNVSSQITSLASSVSSARSATFKAVYTSNYNGTQSTVTVEQQPPKSFFGSASGSVINTGTATYVCSSAGGRVTCITVSAGAGAASSLTAFFSPDTFVGAMQQAQAQVAAHVAGVSVDFSSQSFAGQDSICMSIVSSGQTAKYCATKSGILAYFGAAGSSFELTSYSSTISAADFELPAGATVQ